MGGRGSTSGAKLLDKSVQRGIIEENSKRMAENDVITEYVSLGILETSYLENEFGSFKQMKQ